MEKRNIKEAITFKEIHTLITECMDAGIDLNSRDGSYRPSCIDIKFDENFKLSFALLRDNILSVSTEVPELVYVELTPIEVREFMLLIQQIKEYNIIRCINTFKNCYSKVVSRKSPHIENVDDLDDNDN